MSKTRRDIQEQLQKDEVAETLQKIAADIRKNRTLLITMAVVALIGGLAFMAFRSHRENVLSDSNAKLNMVLSRYESLTGLTDPAQTATALKAAVDAADQLTAAYPDSKLGREALYIKGNAYYFTDSFPEAQKAFNEYLAKAETNTEKAKGEIALGYTFENEGFLSPKARQLERLNTALNHYIQAANLAQAAGDSHLYYYAQLCQARIYEVQTGQEAKAVAIYKKILAERPEPVVRKENEERTGGDSLVQMLRQQVERSESQLSFQATAKLRLDRLEAKPEGAPVTVTSEVKAPAATAAPAPAKPAAAAPATTSTKN